LALAGPGMAQKRRSLAVTSPLGTGAWRVPAQAGGHFRRQPGHSQTNEQNRSWPPGGVGVVDEQWFPLAPPRADGESRSAPGGRAVTSVPASAKGPSGQKNHSPAAGAVPAAPGSMIGSRLWNPTARRRPPSTARPPSPGGAQLVTGHRLGTGEASRGADGMGVSAGHPRRLRQDRGRSSPGVLSGRCHPKRGPTGLAESPDGWRGGC